MYSGTCTRPQPCASETHVDHRSRGLCPPGLWVVVSVHLFKRWPQALCRRSGELKREGSGRTEKPPVSGSAV